MKHGSTRKPEGTSPGEQRADVQRVSYCERAWRTFEGVVAAVGAAGCLPGLTGALSDAGLSESAARFSRVVAAFVPAGSLTRLATGNENADLGFRIADLRGVVAAARATAGLSGVARIRWRAVIGQRQDANHRYQPEESP